MAGACSALFLCLWIGIGAQIHKPYYPKPPTSIEGCPNATFNNTLNWTTHPGGTEFPTTPIIDLTTVNTTV
jgi:hypothetical protein